MSQKMMSGLLAAGLLVVTALPASAQLWFFPDYQVPSVGPTGPATFIAGTYGRGLNEASGQADAIGGVVGRTGESVSFLGGVGLVTGDGSDELTVGGAVGVDVAQGESATVSVQGGIGWMSVDFFTETLTMLRFPIGVAIKGQVESPEAVIVPWVMPRVNISRISAGGNSETETDFGASAGVSFTFPSGFGVHTALDILLSNTNLWYFGGGVHYLLGS